MTILKNFAGREEFKFNAEAVALALTGDAFSLIGAFVWTVMNLILGSFILPFAITGINSAAFHGLFIHYIVGLWITPAGYAGVGFTEGLNRDSHGNPAMLVDAQGFLHVFWGCHLGPMRYARSEKPEDISTWVAQPPAAPHATYPQAMLTASGRIELFYRGGGHTDDWVLRSSDDGGRTWSAEAGILDGVRPSDAWYASSAQGPDGSVHVGVVRQDYTEAPLMIRYDVFHVLRDSAGVWRAAPGERLTLPLSPADANRLCKVYDSQARQSQDIQQAGYRTGR